MKFAKINDRYIATRKDGIVVTIEHSDYEGKNFKWVARHSDDFNGDHTVFSSTKRELVLQETEYNNRIK